MSEKTLTAADIEDLWTAYEARVHDGSMRVNAARERVAATLEAAQSAAGLGNAARAMELEAQHDREKAQLALENARNEEASKSNEVDLVRQGGEILRVERGEVDADEEDAVAKTHAAALAWMKSKASRTRLLQHSRNLGDWSVNHRLPRILPVEPFGPSGKRVGFDSERAYFMDAVSHYAERREATGAWPEDLATYRKR